jgi:hypothetical protein
MKNTIIIVALLFISAITFAQQKDEEILIIGGKVTKISVDSKNIVINNQHIYIDNLKELQKNNKIVIGKKLNVAGVLKNQVLIADKIYPVNIKDKLPSLQMIDL